MEKRFSHGVQFLSHYTWSRAMSHESYYFAIDKRVGYGASYYNRPQAFVLAGNWDLPFGKGKSFGGNSSRAVDYLIGGFALNGTLTVEGGLPYTPGYQSAAQTTILASAGLTAMARISISAPASFDPNY